MFDNPIEDENERFGYTQGITRDVATGPEPDTAFWMAEPDGDLPLTAHIPGEIRC